MPENQSSDFSLDSLMNTSNTPVNNSSLESSLSFGEPSNTAPLNINDIAVTTANVEEDEEEELRKQEQKLNKKMSLFFIAIFVIILDLLGIAVLFSFNLYETEHAKKMPDLTYQVFYDKYETIKNKLPHETLDTYKNLPLFNKDNSDNFRKIISTDELSFTEKKQILESSIQQIGNTITSKVQKIDEIESKISRYYFLPEELRDIMEDEGVNNTDLQRALSSLEIIKFNTASIVFTYLDSILGILQSKTGISKEEIVKFLQMMNERGESDFASYVYLCYFNPYETNNDCNIVGDLNVYYKDILNDKELDVENFKKIMKYIDSVLEQSDIPNFSIIFHTFDPIREIIDFNVEINLNKQDELNLIKQGIKNPNIFILSNIINSLKKSVFVLGNDVDAKTITVNTRNIIDGNTSYTVKTSQKAFSLPIQKSSEREIFDYINSSFLEKLEKGRQALDLSEDEGIKEFTEKDEKSDEGLENEITFDEEDEDDDEDEDETDDEGLSNDEDNEDDTNNDSNDEGDENEESEDLTTDNVAEFTEDHGSADDLSLETLDFEDEDLFDDEDELNDEDDGEDEDDEGSEAIDASISSSKTLSHKQRIQLIGNKLKENGTKEFHLFDTVRLVFEEEVLTGFCNESGDCNFDIKLGTKDFSLKAGDVILILDLSKKYFYQKEILLVSEVEEDEGISHITAKEGDQSYIFHDTTFRAKAMNLTPEENLLIFQEQIDSIEQKRGIISEDEKELLEYLHTNLEREKQQYEREQQEQNEKDA